MSQGPIAEQKVRLGADGDALAAEMEMAVEHGVDQLAALAAIFERHRTAADARQQADEIVIGAETGQAVEQRRTARRPAASAPSRRRASARRCAIVQAASPIAAMSSRVDAAERRGREVFGHMAVERAGEVRQECRLQAEGLDDVAQLVDVAGRQMAARQHVDALRRAARAACRFGHEGLDQLRDGLAKPSWNASLKSGVET